MADLNKVPKADTAAAKAIKLVFKAGQIDKKVANKFADLKTLLEPFGTARYMVNAKANIAVIDFESIDKAKAARVECEANKEPHDIAKIVWYRAKLAQKKTARTLKQDKATVSKNGATQGSLSVDRLMPCKWEMGEFAEEGCWAHRTKTCPFVHKDQPDKIEAMKNQPPLPEVDEQSNPDVQPKQRLTLDVKAANRFIFHELGSKVRNPHRPAKSTEEENEGESNPKDDQAETKSAADDIRARMAARLHAKSSSLPLKSSIPSTESNHTPTSAAKMAEDEGEFSPDEAEEAESGEVSNSTPPMMKNENGHANVDVAVFATPRGVKHVLSVPQTPATPMMAVTPNASEPVWLQDRRVAKFKASFRSTLAPPIGLSKVADIATSEAAKQETPTEVDSETKKAREQFIKRAKQFQALRPIQRFPNVDENMARIEVLRSLDTQELQAQTKLVAASKTNLDSGFVIGTCGDMCPELERYLRLSTGYGTGEGYVHWLECEAQSAFTRSTLDHSRAVKAYRKEAADNVEALASQLRSEPVLQRTMVYLCKEAMSYIDSDEIVDNPDRPKVEAALVQWHKFLEDRTRGIRKDMSIQQITTPGGVLILERIIRFHIYAGHYMCNCEEYVDQQNSEQMKKAFKTLRDIYDMLRRTHGTQPNEAEFRAYDILANLHDPTAMLQAQSWPETVMMSDEVQFAIKMYSLVQRGSGSMFNYVRFFQLVRQTSILNACLLNNHFTWIRRHALAIMHRSFSTGPGGKGGVPISTVQRLIGFDTEEATTTFLRMHSMNVVSGVVEFERGFEVTPSDMVPNKEFCDWIEKKRPASLGELAYGGKLPEVSRLTPTDTFTNESSRGVDVISYLSESTIACRSESFENGNSPRSRKRSIADVLGMEKNDSRQKQARPAFVEKALAEKKRIAEEEKRKEEERLKREAEQRQLESKRREEKRRKEEAERQRLAEIAAAKADAEKRRLAEIAAAEAEAERNRQIRIAEEKKAAEAEADKKRLEAQQLKAAAEAERRREEEVSRVVLENANSILDNCVAIMVENLCHKVHLTEQIVKELCKAWISEEVNNEIFSVASSSYEESLRDFRLLQSEMKFRTRRVFNMWSNMAKRRAALRMTRRPAISVLQQWKSMGTRSGLNPASYIGRSTSIRKRSRYQRDSTSILTAESALTEEFQRRNQISQLYSQWTPLNIYGSRLYHHSRSDNVINVNIVPSSTDDTMLYHYVHRRIVHPHSTYCQTNDLPPSLREPSRPYTLRTAKNSIISIKWAGGETVAAVTAGILFMLDLHKSESGGSNVHEAEMWLSARKRIEEIFSQRESEAETKDRLVLAIIYDCRGLFVTPETILKNLGISGNKSVVKNLRVFGMDPSSDADHRMERSGLLEECMAWMVNSLSNLDRNWSGLLSEGIRNTYTTIQSRIGSAIRPSLAVQIFNTSLDLLKEVVCVGRESRQTRQLLDSIALPPFDINSCDDVPGTKSIEYLSVVYSNGFISNTESLDSLLGEMMNGRVGVVDFVINLRISQCLDRSLTVTLDQKSLESSLHEFTNALSSSSVSLGPKKLRLTTII